MFEKDLTKPIILEQHEALLRRLPENHIKRQEIAKKRDILSAGYRGEERINYYLSLFPTKSYHIFHDIRLPIGKSHFQIDTILLSTKSNFIIEGKNFAGSLLFQKNQLIQEIRDETHTYQNPITQVNRHKILLKYLFEKNRLPWLPFEQFVCISNPKATIVTEPRYVEAEKRVLKAENLVKRIDEHEKMYRKDTIDEKNINKLKRYLLTKHVPNRVDILANYAIANKEVVTGVQCPYCNRIGMEYEYGHWRCPTCHSVSKVAHHAAVQDFFMIFKPTVTNTELKEFLHLPSARAATYQLSLLNISSTGTTKDKMYHQPPLK